MDELTFAQRFPFSLQAQKLVKKNDFSLDDVPEQLMNRAKAMVLTALKRKPYFFPELAGAKDVSLTEVLAFPVAKILVSLIASKRLERDFSRMFSNSTFKYLEAEKKGQLLELAHDLKAEFSLSERKPFFAEIKLVDFLSAEFDADFMKLVNQKLEGGKVFLGKNDFIRFLSALAFLKVFSSFPLEVKAVPVKFKDLATELKDSLFKGKTGVSLPSFSGKLEPEKFPPCMQRIYSDFLEGKNVAHLARFDLATFLVGANCPEEEIIALFGNAPNFKEKITRYQVKKIRGRGPKPTYSAPGCVKIRSHKLCFPDSECKNLKHPLQYYRKKVFPRKKKT